MDIETLQALVISALEDIKGQNIVLFDTTKLSHLFDRIIIASGTSNRQTKALAASVRDKVRAAGCEIFGIEGEETGEWVLVDLGSIVVHIMQPAIRDYYHLEEIWGVTPIDIETAKKLPALHRTAQATEKPGTSHKRSKPVTPETFSKNPAEN